MCRVYVISGSFRAFDRRPLDKGKGVELGRVHEIENRFAATCAHQQAPTVDRSNSIHGAHVPEAGGSSSTNWGVNSNHNDNEVQLQEPLWEWELEQFNWP